MNFWQALDAIHGMCQVRKYWQHYLNGQMPLVQRYLRPKQGLVECYPRWAGGIEVEPYDVVEHAEDHIVIVHPESRDATPIAREELIAWELNRELLQKDLAKAFGFRDDPNPIPNIPFTRSVGAYEPLAGYVFPVYLTLPFERAQMTRALAALGVATERPILILAPTSRRLEPLGQGMINQRKYGFLPLCDALTITEAGLKVTSGGEVLLNRFREAHVPAEQTTRGKAFFPTPSGATWKDVRIRFLDGHSVSVKVGEESAVLDFREMGMADNRTAAPNKQWKLLESFANGHGEIRWDHRDADVKNKKRKSLLSQDLKAFFRLEGEPLTLTDDGRGWQAEFSIQPDN